MVDLVSRTRRDGGVTLVEAALVNDCPGPRRVRVESRLTPVWPPRRRGRPAAGWDEAGYAVTLAAGERHGFGFATPAEPEDPAVVLVADRPPEGDDDPVPAEVVRELGDPVPPRDAVRPAGIRDPDGGDADREGSEDDGLDLDEPERGGSEREESDGEGTGDEGSDSEGSDGEGSDRGWWS